ncbi:hypothetical protein [Spiroplasma endosymbiont of Apeira syringaria]
MNSFSFIIPSTSTCGEKSVKLNPLKISILILNNIINHNNKRLFSLYVLF